MESCREDEAEHGDVHEVMLLVLSYLPVYELFVASRVCRFLRDAVKNEMMLWSNVVVEGPLASRVTDHTLWEVASRAEGKLKSLVLRDCAGISDDGLHRVVHNNPLIHKLWLPGCTGLNPSGVINAVKALPNLRTLQINGIYHLTTNHLSILHHHISTQASHQPFLYHTHRLNPATLHDRPIDVEVCPRCSEVRMAYACTRRSCNPRANEEGGFPRECRACTFCITRCEECGGCVEHEDEPEETACGDVLCLECWLGLLKCYLCNKPYCRYHGGVKDGHGFVCEVCQGEVAVTSDDESEI